MNEVFEAILFEGDWQSDEFKTSIIEYLSTRSGYSMRDAESYYAATREYENSHLYQIDFFNDDVSLPNISEYIEESTDLTTLQIYMLMKIEDQFYQEIQNSYDAINSEFIA